MDFDPDQYISQKQSSGFDPDSYISEKSDPDSAVVKAVVGHAANAATLGYLPQISAAVEPAVFKAMDLATGSNASLGEKDYVQRRDAYQKDLDEEYKNNPTASAVGTVGGAILGGAALSPLSPAKAATVTGRIAQAMGTGAIMGAVSNPGDSAGEVDPVQLKARVKDAALTAPLAGAFQGAAEGVGAIGSAISDRLSGRAAQRFANAMGMDKSGAKTLLSKYGPEAVQELGQAGIDEGLSTPLATPAKIMESAEAAKQKVGVSLGDLLTKADSGGAPKISAKDIALKLADSPDLQALNSTPGMEGGSEKVGNMLQTLYNNGDNLSLKDAQSLRQGIDEAINFSKRTDTLPMAQQFLYDMRSEISGAMNDSVNAYQGDDSDVLRALNRRYSDLSRIEDIATRKTAGNVANRAIGLTDTIAGAGGAGVGATIGAHVAGPLGAKVGSVAGGILGTGTNKLARTYGPGLDAYLSNAFAKAAEAGGNAVENNSNPVVFSDLLNQLVLDRDPKKTDNAIARRLSSSPK